MRLIDADELKKFAIPCEIHNGASTDLCVPLYQIDNAKTPQGEWIRKEDVIHSIAKQYSEHNELVPIWLSIGDMRGGAE